MQQRLDLFAELGLSDAQVGALVAAQPTVLLLSLRANLRPKAELLRSLGVQPAAAAERCPAFWGGSSLERRLLPRVAAMRAAGCSAAAVERLEDWVQASAEEFEALLGGNTGRTQ